MLQRACFVGSSWLLLLLVMVVVAWLVWVYVRAYLLNTLSMYLSAPGAASEAAV